MIPSIYLLYIVLCISLGIGIFLLIDGIQYRSVAETGMGMLIITLSFWVLSIG